MAYKRAISQGNGFSGCQYCRGAGCLSCPVEEKRHQKEQNEAYDRAFPNGPQPMFTAHFENPEEMRILKEVFHADRLKEAFAKENEAKRNGDLNALISVFRNAENGVAVLEKNLQKVQQGEEPPDA